MRFHHAVLLAALAIAPVCAERLKASPDERGIVDSTLSAVGGLDCGGGGLRSSGGGGGGGGRGCDNIRWRMVGGVAAAAGGRAEKKDTVVVRGRGGDGDNNIYDVHASGTDDDGSVIYSRQLLRGGYFSAQHSSEAMIFAAIALVGAVVAAVVSIGDLGGGAVVGGGNSGARRRGAGFPGPARIVRADMHDHLLVIFGLMAERRVHLELGSRSARAIALWQNVFDQYFHPINGSGRAWTLWTNPREGITKFRKSVMTGLQFHFDAFNEGVNGAPTQVQILANDLMVERSAALATQEAAVAQQVQHQGLLLAATRGMGLVTPGQGVQAPPNLGFDLTRNQELALSELAQRTRSVDTRGAAQAQGNYGNIATAIPFPF